MTLHEIRPDLRAGDDDADGDDLYRIGTVANLTGIAVERLRAWERRYGVTPAHRVGKTRFYSAEQLSRLEKLRTLSDNGHPISSIVELPDDELDRRLAGQRQPGRRPAGSIRAGLIGPNLLVLEQQSTPAELEVVGRWANMAAFCSDQSAVSVLNTVIVQLPVLLHRQIEQIRRFCPDSSVIAVYQFATPRELASVQEAGVPTLPWPVTWADLEAAAAVARVAAPAPEPASPRRFSDDELIAIAVSGADEPSGCARHLVELITQVNAFAEYSEEFAAAEAEQPDTYERLHAEACGARACLERALQALIGPED